VAATAINYMSSFQSVEICAGGGGQALGLERAGFEHVALVELDPWACATLRLNRPHWNVIGPNPTSHREAGALIGDVRAFTASSLRGTVDLLAGGVPCPPFSKAGKQLGAADERDLFPEALRLVRECVPKAVMLENVRGLLDPKFAAYRESVLVDLNDLGYLGEWRLLNASDYGVPQLRPRAVLVALRSDLAHGFDWPEGDATQTPTVGQALRDQMAAAGWEGAEGWALRADRIAPTLVGGSKKHGGPDLGPTRARREWAQLGVDGLGVANEPPEPGFVGMPKLTVQMAATLQGFPADWRFAGRKTNAYRQVGNAFPPPVAEAVGTAIRDALSEQQSALAA
jgi:DNA (cytosine-5)-methyltransferase 1